MTPQERLVKLGTGEDPRLIAKLKSGYAVLAENQYLLGYCLLLANPLVSQLNQLEGPDRLGFLEDMSKIGDAVQQVTRCKRVNYAIYGNLDPFLHAHIWPRYEDEEESFSSIPPLTFPVSVRENPETIFSSETHAELLSSLRKILLAGNL